jgi:hypothetical protein
MRVMNVYVVYVIETNDHLFRGKKSTCSMQICQGGHEQVRPHCSDGDESEGGGSRRGVAQSGQKRCG